MCAMSIWCVTVKTSACTACLHAQMSGEMSWMWSECIGARFSAFCVVALRFYKCVCGVNKSPKSVILRLRVTASISKSESEARTLLIVSLSEAMQAWCKPCLRSTRQSLHHRVALQLWLMSLPQQNQCNNKLNRNTFVLTILSINLNLLLIIQSIQRRSICVSYVLVCFCCFTRYKPVFGSNSYWNHLLEGRTLKTGPFLTEDIRGLAEVTDWRMNRNLFLPCFHSTTQGVVLEVCVAEESRDWNDMLKRRNMSLLSHPAIWGFMYLCGPRLRLSGNTGSGV